MSKQKKKQEKWIKPRHRIITKLAEMVLRPYTEWKYGIRVEKFKEQGNRPYLVLYNHQTGFDQFFVGMAWNGPVYYLATEDIFSLGFLSSLLRWAVEPIPIRKQTKDIAAVKTCYKVAKEGGTIAIAPEGNRTYSGKTEYISPAIASMAKMINLPIALFRIEGGYGVQPRWSDVTRKGKMRAYVSQVIEPSEYKELSNEELAAKIEEGLYVNEAVADGEFRSDKRAEFLERAIYVCPYCGLSEFESHGNEMECKKCHRKVLYGVDKTLKGIGYEHPFQFVNDWYEYQQDYINNLDVTKLSEEALYEETITLSEVILYKKKDELRSEAKIKLYGDKITVDEGTKEELRFPFSEVSAVSVLGKNKANIYHNKKVYQIKGSEHFNSLKYVNMFYRYKNISRGEENVKFLGL